MIFFSLNELKEALGDQNENLSGLTISEIKSIYSAKIGNRDSFEVKGILVDANELFYLLDLYEKEENRVFSDWILTDNVLLSYFRNKNLPRKIKVNDHKGHILEGKYREFVAKFLFPKLERDIKTGIKNHSFADLLLFTELSQLLPKKEKASLETKVSNFIESIIEGSKKDNPQSVEKLLSIEVVLLINKIDNSFYPLKIAFVDAIKRILKKDENLTQKATRALRRVELHSAHKEEVVSFLSGGDTPSKKRKNLKHLFRTPLFYLAVLVLAVLIYILIPKEVTKPAQNSGLPQNRTGLDSLSLSDIKNADSLLGYKGDSIIMNDEEFMPPPLIEQYQMIDGEDTLRNELARSLSISMTADYTIQNDQKDSYDCQAMSMGNKRMFQMEGVKDIDLLSGGFNHRIENNSGYDLYILLFENDPKGDVYGSFIPAQGNMSFEFYKGMRLIVYSGKDFTKFNPLQHKNGGYGSVVHAKKIDERFTAHFCTLNQFNLQLMSKSWKANKAGKKTTITSSRGPIELKSDVFEE